MCGSLSEQLQHGFGISDPLELEELEDGELLLEELSEAELSLDDSDDELSDELSDKELSLEDSETELSLEDSDTELSEEDSDEMLSDDKLELSSGGSSELDELDSDESDIILERLKVGLLVQKLDEAASNVGEICNLAGRRGGSEKGTLVLRISLAERD